jgi:hypothetical protein
VKLNSNHKQLSFVLHLPCPADAVPDDMDAAAESIPTIWKQAKCNSHCCALPCPADAVPEDMDAAAESSIMERRPLLLTPVPHEQPWATAAWAGHPVEPPTPSEMCAVSSSGVNLEDVIQ